MKRLITPLLLLLPLFWMTACSSDDDNNPTPEQGSEVQFKIGFEPTTRMITDAIFNSTFEENDQIGVFALKTGTTTNPVAQNVKLTRQANGSWASSQKIYYLLDGSNLDFYAYYPYQGDGDTTMDDISFAVLADQRTADDYSQSDLLTAIAKDQSSNLVGLSFTHLMAMVQVTTKGKSPVPTFREGTDGFEVVLKNVKHSTTAINWTNNTADPDLSATAQDIRMYRVPTADGSWVFRALIPSQELVAGGLFEFEQTQQGNVIDMGYSVATAVTPAKGKAASYKVTLDYQLDANHKYALGDVYPYKGTPVGIVYEISNDGENGKIVSLDEGKDLKWSTKNEDTNAKDDNNGINNMNTIKGLSNDFGDYPAFAWVHAKNSPSADYSVATAKGIWYLPAKDELQAFYDAYNAFDKTAFNAKLIAAGGKVLPTNRYWSSSEGGLTNLAWIVDFYVGSTSHNYKSNGRSVRAVSAF